MSEGHSFFNELLSVAQTAMTEAITENAADSIVNSMFDKKQKQQQNENIYPELPDEQEDDRSAFDQAQASFADAFAKKTAEKIVDCVFPIGNKQNEQSEFDRNELGTMDNSQDQSSRFDLSALGASLFKSLSNASREQAAEDPNDSGIDLSSLGATLIQCLPGATGITSLEQNRSDSDHEVLDLSALGTTLLQSLTGAVPYANTNDPVKSELDLSAIGATLLHSLAGVKTRDATREQYENTAVDLTALGATFLQFLSSGKDTRVSPTDSDQAGIDLSSLGADLLKSIQSAHNSNTESLQTIMSMPQPIGGFGVYPNLEPHFTHSPMHSGSSYLDILTTRKLSGKEQKKNSKIEYLNEKKKLKARRLPKAQYRAEKKMLKAHFRRNKVSGSSSSSSDS